MMKDVTAQDFDEMVLASERPVLVDFWAPWCGPCKALAPTLAEVAAEYEGEVDVCKIDIDANPELAQRYGVRGIPLLVMFRDGEEQARSAGTLSRSRLDAFVGAQVGTGE